MNFPEIRNEDFFATKARIEPYINETPLISNPAIDRIFKAKVFLKMETQQKTQSFKARGAFNAVLTYREKFGTFPQKIVVQSSGNHAQAVALVGKIFKIPVLVFMAKNVASCKIQATRDLGAEIVICEKRTEANESAIQKQKEGYFFIHPSDNDQVILGQATCANEAFSQISQPEKLTAIFAACGGGGLLAGCYLAKKFWNFSQENSPKISAKIFGCEPQNANDAATSYRLGKITGFEESPLTIADGARTLKVSARCFKYLQKLDGFLEISEERIDFWQKSASEILQQKIEPTAALSIAGLENYLQKYPSLAARKSEDSQQFLLIISGGNVTYQNQ